MANDEGTAVVEDDVEVVDWHLNPGATRPCWDFQLRDRTVRLQGDGFYRDIRIREYTDSDIRMLKGDWPIIAMLACLGLGIVIGFMPGWKAIERCETWKPPISREAAP